MYFKGMVKISLKLDLFMSLISGLILSDCSLDIRAGDDLEEVENEGRACKWRRCTISFGQRYYTGDCL